MYYKQLWQYWEKISKPELIFRAPTWPHNAMAEPPPFAALCEIGHLSFRAEPKLTPSILCPNQVSALLRPNAKTAKREYLGFRLAQPFLTESCIFGQKALF